MSNTGWSTPYYGTTVGDWDTITIGPIVFSGTKITIDGSSEYKIDVKPAPGFDGARETPIGYMPATIEVAIELWSDSLMQAWAALVGAYKPKPGKTKPVPVTCDHPLLRMYSLSRFYVKVTPLPRSMPNQTYEGHLRLLEYFPAPKTQGQQTPTVGANFKTVLPGSISPGSSLESTPSTAPKPSQNNTGPT